MAFQTQGHQAAQGHADVLQADIDQVQGLLDSLDEQNRQPESELENTPGADQANSPENPSQHSLLDDKVSKVLGIPVHTIKHCHTQHDQTCVGCCSISHVLSCITYL